MNLTEEQKATVLANVDKIYVYLQELQKKLQFCASMGSRGWVSSGIGKTYPCRDINIKSDSIFVDEQQWSGDGERAGYKHWYFSTSDRPQRNDEPVKLLRDNVEIAFDIVMNWRTIKFILTKKVDEEVEYANKVRKALEDFEV